MSLNDRLKRLRDERRAKRPDLMVQLDLQTERLRMLRQAEDALDVGDNLPEGELLTVEGKTQPLYDLLKTGPMALVFYRGGWCPFCRESLLALEEIHGQLRRLGFSLVAASPDRPALIAEHAKEGNLTFALFSDPDNALAQLCGLDFELAPAYVAQYQAVGTDIPRRQGNDHWRLPVPAAFLIDSEGTVRFAYKNPDPTERVEPVDLVAAAEAFRRQAADGKAD